MSAKERIEEACRVLSQEARELYLGGSIDEIHCTITPLNFFREYVSKNVPVIIRGGVKHWSAINKWSTTYFREVLGNTEVSVAVTPNGYADAIAEYKLDRDAESKEYFIMPEERHLTMSAFLDTLENPKTDSVFYIQKQNSNFTQEFSELWSDIEFNIPWANEAFGKTPDAVNFWMGDSRAITSMHKDPYENIYCVVSGEKTFILHPPTDLPWIPFKQYQSAVYKETEPGKWSIEPVVNEQNGERSNSVPWICIDPLNPDYERFPQYRNVNSFEVTVKAGDVLYLPSLWFHHVTQSHGCTSINYWYDMEFDIKYAYFKALEVLCKETYS